MGNRAKARKSRAQAASARCDRRTMRTDGSRAAASRAAISYSEYHRERSRLSRERETAQRTYTNNYVIRAVRSGPTRTIF